MAYATASQEEYTDTDHLGGFMQEETQGFFLALEGIDGAGKTTLLKWIQEWFTRHSVEHTVTREPGGTPTAELIRNILLVKDDDLDEMAPMAETLLFMAARDLHWNNLIKPKLDAGELVISDRFCDSTFCYQGAGRGMDVELLQELHRLALKDIRPNLTIVLDGDPELFRQRAIDRGDTNRLDEVSLEFHTASRKLYKQFAEASPERYLIINAELDFHQVTAQVIPHLMTIVNGMWKRPTL